MIGFRFSKVQDEPYQRALSGTRTALAQVGRVQVVDRAFLPHFVFAADDTVVTLGQGGFGRVTPETPLILESQMAENGVFCSAGIEKDSWEFYSGTQAVLGIAERKGVLVESENHPHPRRQRRAHRGVPEIS